MATNSERAMQARGLVREMPEAERPISEQFRVVAKQWVEADAAANLLEDTKSSVFSELVLRQTDVSVARAEHTARCSTEYRDHLRLMTEARSRANLLKVQMRYLEMRFSEWQSSEANQRKERTMGRQAT